MWNSIIGIIVVALLAAAYIFAFRSNNKGKNEDKGNCGGGCAGCSGCSVNKELKDVIKK